MEILELLGPPPSQGNPPPRASGKRSTPAAGSKPYPVAARSAPLRVSEPEAAYAIRGKAHNAPPSPLAQASFKMSAVESLAERVEVSADDLMTVLGIVGRTAQRRWSEGELTAEESDRLYRIARIVHRAIEVLGSQTGASRWLRRPQALFEGAAPFALLGSDAGAKAVEDQLGRIDYGIFA